MIAAGDTVFHLVGKDRIEPARMTDVEPHRVGFKIGEISGSF
jgi:hypothetical protein